MANTRKLTTIEPDGSVIITLSDGTQGHLERLQKIVGGYIEQVPGFIRYENQPCIVYCNENGKEEGLTIRGLTINKYATALWWFACPAFRGKDYLCGNVVIDQKHNG